MAKADKSSFDDLIAARRAPDHSVSHSPVSSVTQSPTHLDGRPTKSKDENYTRLTFYIQKDTDIQLRQKLIQQGKRELSDVFQKLAEGWVQGRFEV